MNHKHGSPEKVKVPAQTEPTPPAGAAPAQTQTTPPAGAAPAETQPTRAAGAAPAQTQPSPAAGAAPAQKQATPPAVAALAVSGEPAGKLAVSRVYDDELRAEQAAQALRVWARAQRGLGVAPVAVMARKLSGATTYHPLRIARPRRAALYGLLTGLVLFALPAAGAAGLAAWAVGNIVFGLAGLIGIVPSSQVGTMVFMASLGAALMAALLSGSVGLLLGTAIGALVGLIDSTARGFSGSERSQVWTAITPGTAAVVARTSAAAAPLVDRELERLGGQPAAVVASTAPGKPTDADTRIARTT